MIISHLQLQRVPYMNSFMRSKVALVIEAFIANLARERLLSGMDDHVTTKFGWAGEQLTAHLAREF